MTRGDLQPDAGVARAHKLGALVLDWAGTTVDFGSLAPARTLAQVFTKCGVHVPPDDLRRDMGLPKKRHIARILENSTVREAWRAKHGASPTARDVDRLYESFIPLQCACLAEYSSLIPGVVDAVRRFRARGIKIGSTTGYTRGMLDLLVAQSAPRGYRPDCSIAPDDVGAGRPFPFMLYEIAVRLQVYPLSAMAKAGDTPADIHEGLNAGAWSIGIAGTGNAIGLSLDEFTALPRSEREGRLSEARAELHRAGAHYVVDGVADLDWVLDDIDARLAAGEQMPARAGQPG